jgi:hypothetical protein
MYKKERIYRRKSRQLPQNIIIGSIRIYYFKSETKFYYSRVIFAREEYIKSLIIAF